MVPEKFNVDIISEIERLTGGNYELYTISPVLRELKNIATGKGEASIEARVALLFIEKGKVDVIHTETKNADDAIVETARDIKDCIVATNDKGLKRRCLNNSIPIIYLRSKNHLEYKGVN